MTQPRVTAKATRPHNRQLSVIGDSPVLDGAAPVPIHPFDPHVGSTVVSPVGTGPGYWAGAPGAWWDGESHYLTYRLREPKPARGAQICLAVSDDGERFDTIWSARKEQFGTMSLERSALIRTDDGHWRLYVSYVDPADQRWRIDVMEAKSVDEFDPATREPALTAAGCDVEGVKDPWVAWHGDRLVMLVSYIPRPEVFDRAELHATGDAFNTGLSRSQTGLATSEDGSNWAWQGPILTPVDGAWDTYAARLNSIVCHPGKLVGYYDGATSVDENYEERCGIVEGTELTTWTRVTPSGPVIGPNGGSGSVRYVEAVQGPDWIRYYYEMTRPDGAHELRTVQVKRGGRADEAAADAAAGGTP